MDGREGCPYKSLGYSSSQKIIVGGDERQGW